LRKNKKDYYDFFAQKNPSWLFDRGGFFVEVFEFLSLMLLFR